MAAGLFLAAVASAILFARWAPALAAAAFLPAFALVGALFHARDVSAGRVAHREGRPERRARRFFVPGYMEAPAIGGRFGERRDRPEE